ncbi:hypothetical protein [Clostridium manihotivorum]|uniref:Uncharacterized protein n=1 Tax=Clostridium manihotivorum TaxID=2320868 RepID=A0A410DWF5_9CLOT|nr:hypothetical protein [Clostridium manihotivorum]QAA33419.1 hypothetical protein C1I91_18195 [Clostridium manihotivorum]
MLIKYFKRNDIFKLLKNIDILFHSHVDLLLFQYDSLDYGSWETKVNHCIPMDKREHLKLYLSKADLKDLEKTIKAALVTFKQDSEDLCKSKGLNYSSRVSSQVISYFNKRISDVHW